MTEPARETLIQLTRDLDTAPVECDGMARLVTTRLTKAGIPHQVEAGRLDTPNGPIAPHFWVRCGPWVIDYRVRLWVGEGDGVPHGVVGQGDWQYLGEPVAMPALPDAIFDLLRC
ncbi:hypothetical protein R5M92_04270 [Halomonas sp. Bachu 37]|uniref:hypothetical protein n=1 Tax=Halomonas kashgarensis TaxID=3084920 RepID=UPI003216D5ED